MLVYSHNRMYLINSSFLVINIIPARLANNTHQGVLYSNTDYSVNKWQRTNFPFNINYVEMKDIKSVSRKKIYL